MAKRVQFTALPRATRGRQLAHRGEDWRVTEATYGQAARWQVERVAFGEWVPVWEYSGAAPSAAELGAFEVALSSEAAAELRGELEMEKLRVGALRGRLRHGDDERLVPLAVLAELVGSMRRVALALEADGRADRRADEKKAAPRRLTERA